MAIRINGDNTVASPAITSASDTDTGLQFGTNEVKVVNGNLDITDGNLIVAAGHGIDFSADGNAAGMSSELLDDYETGTYTPAFTHATNVSYTAVNTWGIYTKIGNFVYVTGKIGFTTYTTFPNGWDGIGLPFIGSSLNTGGDTSTGYWGVTSGGTGKAANTFNFGPLDGPNQNAADSFTNIFTQNNDGVGNANFNTIFSSGAHEKEIRFNIAYRTDA